MMLQSIFNRKPTRLLPTIAPTRPNINIAQVAIALQVIEHRVKKGNIFIFILMKKDKRKIHRRKSVVT